MRPHADDAAYDVLAGHYPAELLFHADADTFGTEFMDYALAIKTVPSLDAALLTLPNMEADIASASSPKTRDNARKVPGTGGCRLRIRQCSHEFHRRLSFGLGAEIGISTQKLGPRGPMALEEITTYKWLIEGKRTNKKIGK